MVKFERGLNGKMRQDSLIPKIVIVCGPTGSGKTSFAIRAALQFNGEIVSADSMQVYRHMNIGTAKPTLSEQSVVFHHMIDVVDPDQHFDVAVYRKLAKASVEKILKRGRNVFVVGGTGLYIRALVHGLSDAGPRDVIFRKQLKQQIDKYGAKYLHQELLKIDDIYARKTNSNDVIRVVRALEVFKVTGKTMTELIRGHKLKASYFEVLNIGILWPRNELYRRINQRVDEMISSGFIGEVMKLLNAGYLPTLKSMGSLGYRHISNFLCYSKSWEKTLNKIKRDHRRYAKRQLTWFRGNPDINWFEVDQNKKALEKINDFLSR